MNRQALNLQTSLRGLIFIALYLYSASVLSLTPMGVTDNLKLIGLPCLAGSAAAWWFTDKQSHPLSQSFILSVLATKLTFGFLFVEMVLLGIYMGLVKLVRDWDALFSQGVTLSDFTSFLGSIVGGFFAIFLIWFTAVIFNILQSYAASFAAGLISTFSLKAYISSAKRILKRT